MEQSRQLMNEPVFVHVPVRVFVTVHAARAQQGEGTAGWVGGGEQVGSRAGS